MYAGPPKPGPLAHVDLADSGADALGPQPGHVEQAPPPAGHRPVAVLPLGSDVGHLGRGRHRREPAVGLEAEVFANDVVLREVGVDRQVELDLGRLPQRLALQLGHGLVDHLAVQVVADGGDVTRLARCPAGCRARGSRGRAWRS